MSPDGSAPGGRASFGTVAATYAAARPGYPEAAFDDLFATAGLRPHSPVLEVGAGTGQASVELVRRGVSLVCVELSADLARELEQTLRAAGDRETRVEVADFERYQPSVAAFDLVFGATALHWVAPEAMQRQADTALRPAGWVASLTSRHVSGAGADFFTEVLGVYRQHAPQLVRGPLPTPQEAEYAEPVLAQLTGYGPAAVTAYPWRDTYSAAEYVRLLSTYSNHIGLEEGARRALFDGIRQLVADRYDGEVAKEYLTVLTLRQRRP